MKKLKSLFLCLGLSAIFMVTGCGKNIDPSVASKIEADKAVIYYDMISADIDKNALIAEAENDFAPKAEALESKGIKFAGADVYVAAVNSEILAEKEAGQPVNQMSIAEIKGNKDGYTASYDIQYGLRRVSMNVAYDSDLTITDITFSPVYSMGEAMTKAALNTLLGMGSVFCVLILIMIIIYMFGIIPKIQKAIADKKAKKEKVSTEESVDKTIANIVEKEEGELVDDTELVAVISAAIAAYEGNASTDGFVVRSIRKSQSKKWQNAQY